MDLVIPAVVLDVHGVSPGAIVTGSGGQFKDENAATK